MSIFCTSCGERLHADAKFCPACGAPIAAASAPVTPAAQPAQPSRSGRRNSLLIAGLAGGGMLLVAILLLSGPSETPPTKATTTPPSTPSAGADTLGIMTAGAKAAVVDYLFGKAVHVGGQYAGEAWHAARNAVTGAAENAADALARNVRHTNVADDLVERMRYNLDTL